jgi:MoaA/NifB/PqqE/SkfB family radical SAM enzyme
MGRRCIQTCMHCHVDAGPDRTEMTPNHVFDRVLEIIEGSDIPVVDIAGGRARH